MFTLSPRTRAIVCLLFILPLWFLGPLWFMEHTFRDWLFGWFLIGVVGGAIFVVPYFIYEVVTNRE